MIKKLFLFSVFLSISVQAYSQETIDLNEAVNTALNNNTDVVNLRRSLQIQEFNTSSAKGTLFPDLSLSATWNRNNTFSEGTVRFQNGVPIIIPKQNTWINNFFVGVTSSVTLFNGFSNYQQINFQQENERLIRTQLDKEKYDVVYKVNSSFFDVLKKEKVVDANEETLEDSRRQLASVKEFMDVGKKTIADVYRQDVQVAQDELSLERSRNDLSKSKVNLLLAMNTNLDKEYSTSAQGINTDLSESELKNILDRNSNTDELTSAALNKRYDYKAALQSVNVNKVQLSIDKKNLYFPTISAFGNYGLNASRIGEIADSRSFSFGINVSYPIFQGFKLSNKSQISEITIKQKEEDRKQLEQQIRSDIKKAYLDMETQYKQIEILNRSLKSAEQDKLLSEENYKVGLGTLLDVQTATTKLNNLKIDQINSYYDFLLAERTLKYYSGDLNY